MQNFEFPQAIIDVQHVTCFRFMYDDDYSAICTLMNTDEFYNENVPTDKLIAVILKDESFYCGIFNSIEDDKGVIIVRIRSVVSSSCVVSIPADQILGWCILPERV